MNLSNYTSITSSYASTGLGTTGGLGSGGTTGDAVALSTAKFTGATSSPGGYPVGSTSIDMAGYEGVIGIATIGNLSTGGGAGTSGWATIQYGTIAGATASLSTFVPLQGAFNIAFSTGPFALAVDVYRPLLGANNINRFGAFVVQVPSSSAAAYSITAIRYGPKFEAAAKGTTANSSTLSSVFYGTAISVSPGT